MQSGEECDDGNVIDGDGCSSDCLLEIGYEVQNELVDCNILSSLIPICGDLMFVD